MRFIAEPANGLAHSISLLKHEMPQFTRQSHVPFAHLFNCKELARQLSFTRRGRVGVDVSEYPYSWSMTLRITHTSLAKLEAAQPWVDSGFLGKEGFSAEEIYGPQGKLGWLWPYEWDDAQQMKGSLCANMGGGVPISIIDALVAICVDEEGA